MKERSKITHGGVMEEGMRRRINFDERIREHIMHVLNGSPLTFGEILKRSLNCDPFLLLEILDELRRAGSISSTKSQKGTFEYKSRVLNVQPTPISSRPRKDALLFPDCQLSIGQTSRLRKILQEQLNALPEPAPVYYQWWFSKAIYKDLVNLILSLSRPRTPIAFLGSGTLGALFSHFSANHVSIFDIDEIFLASLKPHCSKSTQLLCYDISKEPLHSWKYAFQAVFVDPPWSSSLLRAFLIRGASFVNEGGKLVISFPQLLTRPSIALERKRLIKLATELGLSQELVLPAFTEYAVPLFEYNAYKHHGIELNQPWRQGDLFIFVKTGERKVDHSYVIERMPQWQQFQRGNSRIFLRRDGRCEDGPPSIHPVRGLEDLTYKSTSSRHRSWSLASLISTRNNIAHARGRKQLSILLKDVLKEKQGSYRSRRTVSSARLNEIKNTIFSMLDISNPQQKTKGK